MSAVALAQSDNRGAVWGDHEVKALIAVWGESDVQDELDGAVRNKVVFMEISKKLQEMGFNRDWMQCRTKIKNLKKRYRAVKDHNGETGKGRMTMKFYRELDCILGHRPASVPATLLDTGIGSSTTSHDSQGSQGSAEETQTNSKCLKFT